MVSSGCDSYAENPRIRRRSLREISGQEFPYNCAASSAAGDEDGELVALGVGHAPMGVADALVHHLDEPAAQGLDPGLNAR
jgi:hypothetical protein